MPRYLIVAHDTATSPALIERVRELAGSDAETEFVLLVPATPVTELQLVRAASGDSERVARARAEEARKAFAEAGVVLLDARAGVASPTEAIADELRRLPGYGGFVVSALPEERSKWLRMDLPGLLEREYGLPVIRVELSPTQFDFWRRRSGWGRTV